VTHLVWDWNGTLLDDLALVVAATNASLATAGGRPITAEEHRRDFRRPI
jgi:phosphoglycolate phosphatase-like HAD superfamily hydrolase